MASRYNNAVSRSEVGRERSMVADKKRQALIAHAQKSRSWQPAWCKTVSTPPAFNDNRPAGIMDKPHPYPYKGKR